ncbi:hypothetical protein D9758_002750 [Tetrapyrgos nigripes]|uniref:F-box domain-containing protein n=1 Tax=Tetrapyrgos nigripes TaxID=182062 RepID=A0A8H5GR39_9AGAR|nr:hypothetical protein D9758_002750 [Tetrapyrgos nigripes]
MTKRSQLCEDIHSPGLSSSTDVMSLPHQSQDPSAPPVLPQELIDCIIDQLQDRKTDLSTCALVGRTWLYSSRKHLFRVLSCRPQLSNRGQVENNVAGPVFAPHIPPLVHRLSFDCAQSPLHLAMLLRISSFTQLRHLTLSNIPLRNLHQTEACHHFPVFLKQCPELEHLALIKVDLQDIRQLSFPPGRHIPHLRSLTLQSLTCSDSDVQGFVSFSPDDQMELEALELEDVDPDVVDLMFCRPDSPFSLSALQWLRLGDDCHDEVLQNYGSSITHLSLHPPIPSYISQLNSLTLPKLRHLTISGNDFKHDAIPSILQQLGHSGLGLQTLVLGITISSAGYPEINSGHDKLICEFIRSMPSLERVVLRLKRKFTLKYPMSHPLVMVLRQREILLHLPETVESDKLVVEIEWDKEESRKLGLSRSK